MFWRICKRLSLIEMSVPTISVKEGDVADFMSDVLVLKHAQGFHGADWYVYQRLKGPSIKPDEVSIPPGSHLLLESGGKLKAKSVLFVGVSLLYDFGYPEIREFAIASMKVLAEALPETETVTMTIHGVGYGLDEKEAFLAQIGGLLEAFRSREIPNYLKDVCIVDNDKRRINRLQAIIRDSIPPKYVGDPGAVRTTKPTPPKIDAGLTTKPHVFVAMPFGEEFEDLYLFGIQGPIHAAGYLCERVDMSVFTGDIMDRIKSRIESASLVLAEVTGANPNVYLEVGYAWGRERPTLILVKEGEDLKYDISSQRCIRYKSINDLARKLDPVLKTLMEEN
ncbi:MAG: hypothetical protein ACXWIF_16285 [Pyrinomonadaceae bacterium]